MTIKEVKCFETNDGERFYTYEEALEHENFLEFRTILYQYTYYNELEEKLLWNDKYKLIQFFIDKGYVKKIED